MFKWVAVGLGDAPGSMGQGVDTLEARLAGVAAPWATLTVNSGFGLDTLILVRA
jgi:hypothetical protein